MRRPIAERPEHIVAAHIDNCPIPARTWEGKPYANLIDDCLSGCPFLKEVIKPEYDGDDEAYDHAPPVIAVICVDELSERDKAHPWIRGREQPEQKDLL